MFLVIPGEKMQTAKLVLLVMVGLFSVGDLDRVAARENRCDFDLAVNGVNFRYDLSPLIRFRGRCKPFHQGSVHVRPGKYISPFYTTIDRPLRLVFQEVGPVVFTSAISALRKPDLTLGDLPKHTGQGADAERMFFPENKPSKAEIKSVGSRRWLVITKFEDRQKRSVESRAFWTLERGLCITVSLVFREDASTQTEWREKRLALLEELVSRLSINPEH